MKKSILLAAAALIAMQAGAQETYENARLANEDLNGTARYVGMGGAMEALGADISTMSTNPAGIGMFRHNIVNGTVGLVAQHDAQSFNSANKTNVSFDQLGFVPSSFCAVKLGKRILICVRPLFMKKWAKDIFEIYKVKKNETLSVQGSDQLKGL